MGKTRSALIARAAALGIEVRFDEAMSLHTSFRIGGPADLFFLPKDVEELARALRFCRGEGLQYVLLGNGSNLLVSDGGFRGAVIATTRYLGGISCEGTELAAGAGAPLNLLAHRARKESLTGLEFSYGIPASVGGAVFMNAGAYGGEMKDVVSEVSYLDPEADFALRAIPADQAGFSYRHSLFHENGGVIVGARFSLSRGDPEQIRAVMEETMAKRKAKQPLELPSAGSTFKRPEGAYAAALIDRCGLKGRRVGGAMVSEKHAGFLVNAGGATAEDVLRLVETVRETVLRETGYVLEMEVRRI
ncbi:MAG TPA: UDP-N-acetylmuramate dehydrogenase [Candidatus Fimivivens faecavium]|nr:UDP-N-acetylmuramate dehydrogenase [Candidatus Fimivivens faecavium]